MLAIWENCGSSKGQQFSPRRGKAVPGYFLPSRSHTASVSGLLLFLLPSIVGRGFAVAARWQIDAPPPVGVGVLSLSSPRLARHVVLGGKSIVSSGVLHWLAPS